jgi:hypothetical protein
MQWQAREHIYVLYTSLASIVLLRVTTCLHSHAIAVCFFSREVRRPVLAMILPWPDASLTRFCVVQLQLRVAAAYPARLRRHTHSCALRPRRHRREIPGQGGILQMYPSHSTTAFQTESHEPLPSKLKLTRHNATQASYFAFHTHTHVHHAITRQARGRRAHSRLHLRTNSSRMCVHAESRNTSRIRVDGAQPPARQGSKQVCCSAAALHAACLPLTLWSDSSCWATASWP